MTVYACRAPVGLKEVAERLSLDLSRDIANSIGGRIRPGQALYLAAVYLLRARQAGEIGLSELLEIPPPKP